MSDIGDPIIGMLYAMSEKERMELEKAIKGEDEDPLFDFSNFEDHLRQKKLENDARLVAKAKGWEFIEICGYQGEVYIRFKNER